MDDIKYRVLHIFSGYGGGISSLIINLLENKTDDFEFDVMAFSFQNGEQFLDRLRKIGCRAFKMPRLRVEGYRAFIRYVGDVLSMNHYDAIHCHITGWSMIPFYRLAKKAGIHRFFLHAHTTRYDRKLDRVFPISRINRLINYRCSNAYFTCSDFAADYIFGKYLKRRKAVLIPNGIAKEKFIHALSEEQREEYIKSFGINPDETVMLHVGRFSPAKNHDFILEFVSALKTKDKRIRLLFVGDGELIKYVMDKSHKMGLNDNILFLGHRSDISNLMQFCDLMILPSCYEGLPTVAVECQATGTPMLLADHITKQCDMGLGLLDFLPISHIDYWLKAFDNRKAKVQREVALSAIEKHGFTSEIAGKEYCRVIRELINL